MSTTTTTVPDIIGHPTADAVPWREAKDGDFIMLRDPASRVQGDLFIIDGVPTFRPDGSMSVRSARVLFDGCWMALGVREFAQACWQAWRTDWS